MSMRLQENMFHSAAIHNIFNLTLMVLIMNADAVQKSTSSSSKIGCSSLMSTSWCRCSTYGLLHISILHD